MAGLRQTDWLDGDAFPDMEAFLLDIQMSEGRCVLCGAEQPIDLRWPSYAIELQSKADGASSGDFEYRACPACEPQLDAMLTKLGADKENR